jgi:DNA-binding FadR family transcriptional regulator
VRQALKRLEQMGPVDVRQGDAMRVRDWRALRWAAARACGAWTRRSGALRWSGSAVPP